MNNNEWKFRSALISLIEGVMQAVLIVTFSLLISLPHLELYKSQDNMFFSAIQVNFECAWRGFTLFPARRSQASRAKTHLATLCHAFLYFFEKNNKTSLGSEIVRKYLCPGRSISYRSCFGSSLIQVISVVASLIPQSNGAPVDPLSRFSLSGWVGL